MPVHKIIFEKPASFWEQALPIGNGILGAMVFGGDKSCKIQLNEETLWSGFPFDNENPQCAAHLEEMRSLIFKGEYKEAEELCKKYFVCRGKGSVASSGDEGAYGSHQTAGDFYIEQKEAKSNNYKRKLNIYTGIVKESGDNFERKYFISYDYNVLVIKISGGGVIKTRFERENCFIKKRGKYTKIRGIMNGGIGMEYAVITAHVSEREADYIYITAATTYADKSDPLKRCEKIIDSAIEAGYNKILKSHKKYFSSIMNRVSFSLDTEEKNETVENLFLNNDKRPIAELYFQFGRYLLLSSSRGILPANLQGLWNKDYTAPWSADYHININIQMNYWPAEVTNLPETLEPFFKYIEFIAEHGRITAQKTYNCNGWVAHTITNPWGFTTLGEYPTWGGFMCAGAWCIRHLWEHYLYTGDSDFIKKYYLIIKGCAEFFIDFLCVDPNTGYLVTCPSNSPENYFIDPKTNASVAMCAAPTMDNSILYEFFTIASESAEIYGDDLEFICKLKETRDRLPPIKIGKYGQIMEWQEDFEEAEPGHRHMSNLYGLHPAALITKNSTPELYEAAKISIERRLAGGGGHTGWSRAWIINFYARLHDGKAAGKHLNALFEKSTLDNLFNNHPPYQIDGNFGGCAGIAEMLLQSHDGFIEILPALPPDWNSGEFKGFIARGGFIVNAKWENGKVISCIVQNPKKSEIKVSINNEIFSIKDDLIYN